MAVLAHDLLTHARNFGLEFAYVGVQLLDPQHIEQEGLNAARWRAGFIGFVQRHTVTAIFSHLRFVLRGPRGLTRPGTKAHIANSRSRPTLPHAGLVRETP